MVLLNIGSGCPRPGPPWINIDYLFEQFPVGTPERRRLEEEGNYMDLNVVDGLPFYYNVDGILMSHVLEHFTMNDALIVLTHCWHALKVGGVLRISVPDPVKFYDLIIREEGGEDIDWGEPNYGAPQNFLRYALLFADHKQLITKDCLDCYLWATGYESWKVVEASESQLPILADIDNRYPFSLFVEAIKGEERDLMFGKLN